ncbi:MAG: LPS export ABC transporter periplasmic protein LptC [Deltaproteobacteria bacterium]
MKNFSQRTLLLGFSALVLLLVPLWHRLLAPLLQAPAITPLPTQQTEPKTPISGFTMDLPTFIQFNKGKKEMQLSARYATSEDTGNQIVLSEVAATLYDKNQKAIRLHSTEALYDTTHEEITLRRSVNIKTDDFTGSTEELHYFPKIKLAETTKKVEISRTGRHIIGTGLNYDIGAGELVIGGNGRVRCVLD